MSSLVYPVLPGLTFGNTRSPTFNTGIQAALSGKESRIAYQLYPLTTFELQYELLRDYVSPSEIKALVGLFMACRGKFDTFLFTDPAFNTVAFNYMGNGDGSTAAFQTVAAYANPGGAFGQEIIQNFNGVPVYYETRYGGLVELLSGVSRTQYLIQSQNFANAAWVKTNITGSTIAINAPDGSTPSPQIVDSSNANVSHPLAQFASGTTAAGAYTFSIFVWNGATEAGFIELAVVDNVGGSVNAVFNTTTGALISTGQVGSILSAQSAQSSAVNAAWNRLSLSFASSGAASGMSVFVYPQKVPGTITYTGTSGTTAAVLWGAQFENVGAPTIYLPTTTAAITQLDYTLGATGIITLSAANVIPASTAYITWSGSFYYRCRFDDDSLTASQFANQFWENKKVTLKQIKL